MHLSPDWRAIVPVDVAGSLVDVASHEPVRMARHCGADQRFDEGYRGHLGRNGPGLSIEANRASCAWATRDEPDQSVSPITVANRLRA